MPKPLAVVVIQLISHVSLFVIPWTAANQVSLSIPSPGACSNICPLSQWYHPTNSSWVIPFSSCLQSFPESGSLPMSQLFALGGQSVGVSASVSVLQWIFRNKFFRMDWLDLLAVQGTLKSLPQHHSSKASVPWCSTFFMVQLSHPYMTTGKTTTLTIWDFVGKVHLITFLYQRYYLFKKQLFNMSSLVTAFLPSSKKKKKMFNFMPAVTICSDFWSPRK